MSREYCCGACEAGYPCDIVDDQFRRGVYRDEPTVTLIAQVAPCYMCGMEMMRLLIPQIDSEEWICPGDECP